MSIKLRNLLNLTEQAPQAPMGADPLAGAPVPAPMAPPQGMGAGQLEEPPTPETPDTTPEPENPSEYDFTKDFRAFEDKKNKAEAEAKKVLLDKMNKRLLNKTIIANASRGYGQPKTDYTIENVKKISVEFWYKDYVVIATDQNDKKYFLTPGINVKIEGEGSEPAPGGQEQPSPQEPQAAPQIPLAGGEEAPNTAVPKEEPPAVEPEPTPQQAPEPVNPEPQPVPQTPPTPKPQQLAPMMPAPEQPQLFPKKKKKKAPVPVAEWIQKDLNEFLSDFMSENIKDDNNGKVNYIPYVKEMLAEGVDTTKVKAVILIPENHMVRPIDVRDIRLAAVDTMRRHTSYGQYSNGSVDISKTGRFYLLEYVKEVGWNR